MSILSRHYCDDKIVEFERKITDYITMQIKAPFDARVDILRLDFTNLESDFKQLTESFKQARKDVVSVQNQIQQSEETL